MTDTLGETAVTDALTETALTETALTETALTETALTETALAETAVTDPSGETALSDVLAETERPLRADARRNRERILESAREVFAEDGIDAQMDDVARQAQVGVGTVYRHFPTKEALMVELVRQKFQLFAAGAREALQRDGEPFAVFADLLRRNAALCARDAALQHALTGVGEHIWAQAQNAHDELNTLSGELMARAQQAGTMRSDVYPTDIAMLMCGVSATMAHKFPGFNWNRHLELAIDMLRAR
jgi:AcrR family transcriptional regulator